MTPVGRPMGERRASGGWEGHAVVKAGQVAWTTTGQAQSYIRSLVLRWHRLSLSQQFGVAASVVIGLGMALLGTVVAERIKTGVVENSAKSAALYMHSYIEPLVQELADAPTLSPATQRSLTNLLASTPRRSRLLLLKVWNRDGQIVFSSEPSLIGKTFPISSRLAQAWSGKVDVEFDDLHHAENEYERTKNVPFIEIYVPMYRHGTDNVIAVSEFYENAVELRAAVNQSRLHSWLVVGGLGLGMLATLFGIVRRGSATIAAQQRALSDRVGELSALLAQNEELQRRAQEANNRSAETTERFLRRIGAELHDGPAQLIGLSLLRLDSLLPKKRASSRCRRDRAGLHDDPECPNGCTQRDPYALTGARTAGAR